MSSFGIETYTTAETLGLTPSCPGTFAGVIDLAKIGGAIAVLTFNRVPQPQVCDAL